MRPETPRPLLVGLAYLSFISLGLPDGLLGVAWPSIRAFFSLPIDALGALLVTFTAGYLLSSFRSGWFLSRSSIGVLLALSCLATAASLLGYTLMPWWGGMVALGCLAGLGAGAIDAGLNTYAAMYFHPRVINWLHACYGIGAAAGPLIMTSVLRTGLSWQWGYGLVGAGQLLLAGCFALTSSWWPATPLVRTGAGQAHIQPVSNRHTLRLPAMWLSLGVFFLYTGLEMAAGAWAYSLFTEARGVAMLTAGTWVSVYWGSLTGGRLLAGLLVDVVPVSQLLRGCMLGLVLGAMLVWWHLSDMLSFLGLAIMGGMAAPIFPALIALTPGRLGPHHAANGVGLQIAAAVLGQSLLPSLTGLVAHRRGLESVGMVLCTAALALFGLHEALLMTGRQQMARPSVM